MKLINKLLLSVIVITGFFLFNCSYAESNDFDLKSPYPGREHSHDQWFRVFVRVGNNPEKLVDTSWRPVFDFPEKLGSGYTADRASNVVNNSELANYLKAANLYDDATGMYLFSKAGAQLIGRGNNYVQFSEWNRNIPIRSTSYDSELIEVFGRTYPRGPGASKNAPIVVRSNSPPSDVVWDGSKFYYALSVAPVDGERRGIINLNKNSGAHKAFVTSTAGYNVGYGEMHMYFPYDTRFTSSAPVIWGDVTAGEKASGYIHAVNLSPWTSYAHNTLFRVYVWPSGEPEPKLAASVQKLQMEPLNTKDIGFEFTVPEKQFRLILTINMRWENGRWVNEPLATFTGATSTNPAVVEMEQEYIKNKIEISLNPGAPVEQPEENKPPGLIEPGNLMALSVSAFLDTHRVTANFGSGFNIDGPANIRFYRQRPSGVISQIGDTIILNLKANSQATVTLDNLGFEKDDKIWATINLNHAAGWQPEQFKGLYDEITYDDNKVSCGVTEKEPKLQSDDETHFATYYPVGKIPKYRTERMEVWEDDWQQVPIDLAEPARVKVRLVPVEK